MRNDMPVLWHIGISHSSEKARWALDHKRVGHVRRTAPPGTHIPVALWLTRGSGVTFPVLQLDGRAYGDSSALVAALEARFPEPPLYPADPAERERALALEDFFDEELGPHARLLAFHELIGEPELLAKIAATAVPGPLRRAEAVVAAYASAYSSLRFGAASEERAATARAKIVAALDRLEAELATGSGEFLVGDSLSVADIAAASLFYPVVAPEGGRCCPTNRPRPPWSASVQASATAPASPGSRRPTAVTATPSGRRRPAWAASAASVTEISR
ncbi:MAG: glutathione S-transferase family protein [Solirubrobacterales bacterium]